MESAARLIAGVATGHKIVVEKSTVPVRAAESIMNILNANQRPGVSYQVCSVHSFRIFKGMSLLIVLITDAQLIREQ